MVLNLALVHSLTLNYQILAIHLDDIIDTKRTNDDVALKSIL
jgi:hypothetical protein